MAALVGIAPDFGAVFAPHVASEFVNRCRLRSPHDVEGNGLMRVAAQAADFEIAIARIECVTERGRWLRRSLKPEHALVPRLDREPVGLLARCRRPVCRRPDRRAVDRLAGLGAHAREDGPGHDRQASRYRLRWIACRAQREALSWPRLIQIMASCEAGTVITTAPNKSLSTMAIWERRLSPPSHQ
jgi:hypothetical protein